MHHYTIDDYWIPRLGRPSSFAPATPVKGWSFENDGLETFQEAPLTQSTEQFGSDVDPLHSAIILVSAPGAVGKSTLARQIASATGSIYIDLAAAAPVGSNSLIGGLATSGTLDPWANGNVTALIDGLDEAILKTTQEGLEAFLDDVAALAVNRDVPTVLFGRTAIVQDTWVLLHDRCDGNIAVLEIGYYGPDASVDFAEASLRASRTNRQHPTVDRKALMLLLQGLRRQTESDGDRFAGYAPVLQAVAKQVEGEDNPSSLVSDLEHGSIQPTVTLHSVVDAVLKREQTKLEPLSFEEPNLLSALYSPGEQLDRLVARVYQSPEPPLPAMSPADEETYRNVLDTWVREHPFLDGESSPSSAVFQAVICTRALKGKTTASKKAVQEELAKGEAANPFLYVFYMDEANDAELRSIPEEHIGVIYSSIRASLAQRDTARLSVEEPDDEGDEILHADVEIELSRSGKDPESLPFQTEPFGPICLGSHVRDVIISMPRARVEIGQSAEVFFVAPVDIQCEDLAIFCDKVIVEAPRDSSADTVYFQADEFTGSAITSPLMVRSNARLLAWWPGVENYPWTNYATEPTIAQDRDPKVDEGLRRLRKFVVEFRAHGKGELARSARKIESQRMTKGTGRAVLSLMLETGIVYQYQGWYFLNADRLGEVTGTNYGDCMTFQFGPKTIEFVRKALGSDS